MDKLVDTNVIGDYCIPILELALAGEDFRGMYPHLVYSARLFQVLAQAPMYAIRLVAHGEVVPLLLRATLSREQPVGLESDSEGRCLVLEALSSLAHFGLWPTRSAEHDKPGRTITSSDRASASWIRQDLPLILADDHACVRTAASRLWASLNPQHLVLLLLVGRRLEAESHGLPAQLWRARVLIWLFPFIVNYNAFGNEEQR